MQILTKILRGSFGLFFMITPLLSVSAAIPEKTTRSRYDDFYKHQKRIKEQDQRRTQGKKQLSEKRKKSEQAYEQARQQFVQRRKAVNQEERERIAEAKILEQKKREQQRRAEAEKLYRVQRQKNLKYQIPENEEFNIQPPPLEVKERPRATRPVGRGLRDSSRLSF